MKKLYNDKGQVAVAVSYEFGGGWSSWVKVNPMNKAYNKLILKDKWDKVKKLARGNNLYTGGLRDCEIEWLDVNTQFRIDECDGRETLVIIEEDDYIA